MGALSQILSELTNVARQGVRNVAREGKRQGHEWATAGPNVETRDPILMSIPERLMSTSGERNRVNDIYKLHEYSLGPNASIDPHRASLGDPYFTVHNHPTGFPSPSSADLNFHNWMPTPDKHEMIVAGVPHWRDPVMGDYQWRGEDPHWIGLGPLSGISRYSTPGGVIDRDSQRDYASRVYQHMARGLTDLVTNPDTTVRYVPKGSGSLHDDIKAAIDAPDIEPWDSYRQYFGSFPLRNMAERSPNDVRYQLQMHHPLDQHIYDSIFDVMKRHGALDKAEGGLV